MNLTVDIGNSSAKAALFDEGRLVEVITNYELRITNAAPDELPEIVDRAIVVSTRGEAAAEIEEDVRRRAKFFVRLDHTTPVPVKNLYATPETLGADRMAAAVGAVALQPGRTMLVVDFGTAITYDIVTAGGEYLGGNISPGAAMRFRALHEFTDALPLCGLPDTAGDTPEFPARDTKTAIESGVVAGIVAETEYRIEEARKKFGDVGVIFTGGDAEFFAGRVKFPIFAVSDLVFQGLNAILDYNANQ